MPSNTHCSYFKCSRGLTTRTPPLNKSEERHVRKFHMNQRVKILCPHTASYRFFTRNPSADMKYTCECLETYTISCSFVRHCKTCAVFNGKIGIDAKPSRTVCSGIRRTERCGSQFHENVGGLPQESHCSYFECKGGVLSRYSKLNKSENTHERMFHTDLMVEVPCPGKASLRVFTRNPLADMKYTCDCSEAFLISSGLINHCKMCPVFNEKVNIDKRLSRTVQNPTSRVLQGLRVEPYSVQPKPNSSQQ